MKQNNLLKKQKTIIWPIVLLGTLELGFPLPDCLKDLPVQLPLACAFLSPILIKVLRPIRHGSGGPQGVTEPLEETYILNSILRLDVDMKLCRLWENLVLLMLLFSHWSHNKRVPQVDTHVQQVDTTTQEQGGQKLYNIYILDTTCINHVTSYILCHGALHGCSTMSLTLCFQRLFLLSF